MVSPKGVGHGGAGDGISGASEPTGWRAWTVVETFIYARSVPGYPSLVVGVMVIGGVQLIMIGIMGEYIGKILSELKARPVYFVAEHHVKRADASADGAAEATRTAAE